MKDLQSEARIRDLEQRMAAMPGSRIFVGLAEEYRRAGRFADALATLRNGLEAHPTYLSARIAIARLYQETGRVPEAVEAFSKVLAADRENLVAAKALGDLYGRQGNAVEAVKKLKLYRALAGDRSVDGRIAELEREAKAESEPPAAAVPPVSAAPPAPAAPPASASPESRLFDPMNYADTSGAFELGPNATLALSTLDFTASEEPELPIRTTLPSLADRGHASGPPPAALDPEETVSLPAVEPSPAVRDLEPPSDPGADAEVGDAGAAGESPDEAPGVAEDSPAQAPPAAEEMPVGELEAAEEHESAEHEAYGHEAAERGAVEELEAVEHEPEEDQDVEELEAAEELPSEPEGDSSASIAGLPPSRTLAELYERQGFPEEARQIYDRLDARPDEISAVGEGFSPGNVDAPPPPPGDLRADKRRVLENWLSRIRTNASAGAR